MGRLTAFKYGTAIITMVVSVYVALQGAVRDPDSELKTEVLASLRRAEKKVVHKPFKVAAGFGACIDIFVDAVPLLESLGIKPPSEPTNHDVITDFDDLAQGFAYFFRYGAAAERYFGNLSLFEEIVRMARTQKNTRSAAGGNGPVMANRLAMEGAEVLLAALSNDAYTNMLWPGIKATGTNTADVDVHLIMEYKTGDTWGKYKSERANRFVIHSDHANVKLSSLEPFTQHMKTFNPKLLIVGGLQMMEKFPFGPGERERRLSALRDMLQNPPTRTNPLVHFELASYVDQALVNDLIYYVSPYVDSFGMNEQELPNLESALKYGNITVLSEAYPTVASVLDQMRTTYKLLRKKYRRVTRIHVHTLPVQAIMIRQHSSWKNTMSAAAHASLTANRHVCGTKAVDVAKSKLLIDETFSVSSLAGAEKISFKPERPVSCWEEIYTLGQEEMDTVLICTAPNLVCTEVYQTVCAGDNISSAGLIVQI